MRLRIAIGALALLGAGIASYLTAVKLSHTSPICPTGGCTTVARSKYASLAGIPTALFGLLAYLAIFTTALRREQVALAAGAAIALGGFAYAVYLLVVQFVVIDAVCTWCVASDVVLTVLAVLAVARLQQSSP